MESEFWRGGEMARWRDGEVVVTGFVTDYTDLTDSTDYLFFQQRTPRADVARRFRR